MRQAVGDAAPVTVFRAGVGAGAPQWVAPASGVHGRVRKRHYPGVCQRSQGKVSQLTSNTEAQ